jgi:hypothetical protein
MKAMRTIGVIHDKPFMSQVLQKGFRRSFHKGPVDDIAEACNGNVVERGREEEWNDDG